MTANAKHQVSNIDRTLLPGSTIGILGGGQLGRMTAMAARSFGYRVVAMDPSPACPASYVADRIIQGSWDDPEAAAELGRNSDVVTLEIEQISGRALAAAAEYAPLRPSAELLDIVRDRIRQKQWLGSHNFPIGPYRPVRSFAELTEAVRELGGNLHLKRAYGGYDGRAQLKIELEGGEAAEHSQGAHVGGGRLTGSLTGPLEEAWQSLGKAPCVAERSLDLDCEISVMAARSPRGEMRIYPPALNHHEHQILAWSAMPAPLDAATRKRAGEIAASMAAEMHLEGILAVEMFLTTGGDLLINELAPRPHNSYHESERCSVTSQFEQMVRAVCNLPLGDTGIIRPGAIANLLGDLWLEAGLERGLARTPRFDLALAIPEVRLHLYEKEVPRPGRKMGHLSATAATMKEAASRVLKAKNLLTEQAG